MGDCAEADRLAAQGQPPKRNCRCSASYPSLG